ncbi:MAG: GntR family transcriptional regulator, partial [Proteobacteria bacterium]|nr:GntR family transcriptional regulator [Pseudomonadota bacterium]
MEDQSASCETNPSGKKSLAGSIYARLRSEILRCSIAPGTDLSEAELAARFDVSKTPVREALGALRQDGLVMAFPRRGYQVTPITFGDMNELFDLRTLLEAGAAEMACERISPREIDTLQKMATADYDVSQEVSLDHFIIVNREFHLAIARTAGNQRLFNLLERQMMELERFFYIGAQSRDVNRETAVEHSEIVAALATRDADRARKLMIKHNSATREGLVRVLSSSRKFG